MPSLVDEAVFRPVRSGNSLEDTVGRLMQTIRLGVVAPGQALPAERDLAARFSVSRDTVREAIPYMQRQGKGSIINTASFVAVLGSATSQISYTTSKGGVLALSRELGVQFAREGIRVNALCPGPVNTPLLTELFEADPERAERRLVHIPMGRFAEASEIAAAVTFLASDDSSFITASTFLVDGGISSAYVTPL